MADNIRDLSVWYPLIPEYDNEDAPSFGVASSIIDACIYVRIPPCDIGNVGWVVDGEEPRNSSMCKAVLDTLSYDSGRHGGTARVTVSYPRILHADPVTLDVQVLGGRDATATPGDSYIVVSRELQYSLDETPIGLEIHPDCLVIMQTAPRLSVARRDYVGSTDDIDNDAMSDAHRGLAADGSVDFIGGYNVSATSVDNNNIVLTAGAGLGLGVYMTPPYSDADAIAPYQGMRHIGLRTINGMHPGVLILPGDTMSVKDIFALDQSIILQLGSTAPNHTNPMPGSYVLVLEPRLAKTQEGEA